MKTIFVSHRLKIQFQHWLCVCVCFALLAISQFKQQQKGTHEQQHVDLILIHCILSSYIRSIEHAHNVPYLANEACEFALNGLLVNNKETSYRNSQPFLCIGAQLSCLRLIHVCSTVVMYPTHTYFTPRRQPKTADTIKRVTDKKKLIFFLFVFVRLCVFARPCFTLLSDLAMTMPFQCLLKIS